MEGRQCVKKWLPRTFQNQRKASILRLNEYPHNQKEIFNSLYRHSKISEPQEHIENTKRKTTFSERKF